MHYAAAIERAIKTPVIHMPYTNHFLGGARLRLTYKQTGDLLLNIPQARKKRAETSKEKIL